MAETTAETAEAQNLRLAESLLEGLIKFTGPGFHTDTAIDQYPDEIGMSLSGALLFTHTLNQVRDEFERFGRDPAWHALQIAKRLYPEHF